MHLHFYSRSVDAQSATVREPGMLGTSITCRCSRWMISGPSTRPGDSAIWAPIVSDVIRRNELQVWFVAERVVDMPLTHLV